jgi:8-oxo-dGTP pyrophosphatase MutT (NUDIX family)
VNDPRLLQLRQAIEKRTVQRQARSAVIREAAVALLIRPREQLEILLIKRAIQERDPWSGQMALPGGRRDDSDMDLLDTAIRETAEEVGIEIGPADLIGALDEVAPRTPRLPPITIAPYVFTVSPETTADIQAAEVEMGLWVPVADLRNDAAASEILIELEEGAKAFPSLRYGDHVIWGLTHRILIQFLDLHGNVG